MRIGTWNMAGRWGEQWTEFLARLDCDVLLLTEVNDRLELQDHDLHRGNGPAMITNRRWAAVGARGEVVPQADPHPASAAALIDGQLVVSSVLPWRSCGSEPPWSPGRHADKTGAAVDQLLDAIADRSVVWGGDWNHALVGPETAGSKEGRGHIERALDVLDLEVPTTALSHRISSLRTIDHVAVPSANIITGAWQVSAVIDGTALSDHDAYVVQADLA